VVATGLPEEAFMAAGEDSVAIFDPFGNTVQSGSATTNSFAYTGREWDSKSLYYYRSRYYSSSMNRFVSEDPARFNGGSNFYRYVEDSPVNLSEVVSRLFRTFD
jgi:RHS repeat-associated protein